MLFDRYEQSQLLFNMNFKEAVGDKAAYRGELVLIEGEVADAQGRAALQRIADDECIARLEVFRRAIPGRKADPSPEVPHAR